MQSFLSSREADRVRFVAYYYLIKQPEVQMGVLLSFKLVLTLSMLSVAKGFAKNKNPTSREVDRVSFVAFTTYCNLIKLPKVQVGVFLSLPNGCLVDAARLNSAIELKA